MTCEYEIANSKNVHCAGGKYLHPGMTIAVQCKRFYYRFGSAVTTCKSKSSACKPCQCNSRGSRTLQCNNGSGKCSCKPGFYGTKCQNRNCEWRWGPYSRCSRNCGYGGVKTMRKIIVTHRQGHGRSCSSPYSYRRSCFNRCCSGQFNCFSRKKCIPGSLKCNYRNDCGDNADEKHCSENCFNRMTPWNYHGKGKVYYLDRHRINCGSSGYVVQSFKLQRSGSRIRYVYKCCKLLSSPPICKNQITRNRYTHVRKGDTVYMDRQRVSCGSSSFVNDVWLSRAGSLIR